ncbi:hypothetical protein GmHk_11G032008 [Glycine max]|nr:hypothetical protein GmHk_11G032008 [Glycine max]
MYPFDDARMCFTEDIEDYDFVDRLKNHPIVFNEIVYDLTKMKRTSNIIKVFERDEKEKGIEVQAEVVATITKVVDDAIVNEVIIDLTNTAVMEEESSSNADKANKVVQRIYSSNLRAIPINYVAPSALTEDRVQDMISQAMDTFVERQRQENENFRFSMQNTTNARFTNLGVVLL